MKHQVLQVSPKFNYLLVILSKLSTLLGPVTWFSLKRTTVEGLEFSIVVKDFVKFIITGYYKILDICTFPQIQL